MSDNNKDKDFAPINVEISDRAPSAAQRNSAGRAAAKTSPSSGKANNGFTVIVLIIAIIACAASAFLFVQLQDSQQAINTAEERIQNLENRLSATGEEMDNSTVALQVKVGELSEKSEELWEQMDKLWASAWRRNQQEIKTLESSVKTIQQDTVSVVNELEGKVSQNGSGLANIQSRIDNLNSKLSAQANELLAISVKQDESQAVEQRVSSESRQMAEKIILLEKRNTSLLQELQQLETKVNEMINRGV